MREGGSVDDRRQSVPLYQRRGADFAHPEVPSGRRHGPGAAGLRVRREGPCQPGAQIRRSLLHAPLRRGGDPDRPDAGRHHHRGGPAARLRGGCGGLHAGRGAPELRRRGGAAGGRRDQALPAELRQPGGGPGRDAAQDVPGHGQGHPRGADQAGRPAAQHAHAEVPAPGAPGAHRPRDAGHLRPAGPPAGRVRGEVGAGGPVPALHRPGGLLRAGAPGGHEARGAGAADRPGDPGAEGAPERGGHHLRDRRAAQALLLHLQEDEDPEQELRSDHGPDRRSRAGEHQAGLLLRAGHRAHDLAPGAGPVQGLHQHAQGQHVPVAAHHRGEPGPPLRGADPHL